MEVMQPCRNPAVIPEVEGVQAFPPAFFYMPGKGLFITSITYCASTLF